MARSTLFALMAFTSLTFVAGQTPVPTFPATPLVSIHYPYTALVRIFCRLPFHRMLLRRFSVSAGKGHSRPICSWDSSWLQYMQLFHPEPGFNVPNPHRQ
jgi:hypothetical protein